MTWTVANTPVIKGVGLHWSHLVTPLCSVCNSLGYLSLVYKSAGVFSIRKSKRAPLSAQDKFRLAKIYEKKSVPVSRPLAFGRKTWVDVIGKPPFCMPSGSSFLSGSINNSKPVPLVGSVLEIHLISIENSLVDLTGWIGKLAKRLDSLMLAVFQPSPGCQLLVTPLLQNQEKDTVIRVGLGEAISDKTTIIVDPSVSFHVVRLEKLLEELFKSVLSLSACFNGLALAANRFVGVQVFTSGLDSGYLGAGIVIIMNSSLAKHVCRVFEVLSQLLFIKLLFKNKLSVSILGLYAGASLAVRFSQADEINSLIARAVNESFFVVLGSDFNKDESCRCASFKKCLDLGLVNSLVGSQILKRPTWANSRGVRKTIDFMFVFSNLINALVHHDVLDVSKHFDMDHQTVSVSLSLDGLLDTWLNFLHKQANRDRWKFDFKSVNENKWVNFRCAILNNVTIFAEKFFVSEKFSDLDVIWEIVCKIILSANKVFKKKWFRGFDEVFTKESLRALVIQSMISSGMDFSHVCSAFLSARKSYHASKLAESQCAKETNIRSAINKRMESFEVNKGHTIRSMLKRLFHKVVLDHLVVNDEMILEPDLVKSKIDIIMKVFDLPDGKAASLLGIFNELWKYCDKLVLDMLLVLLNSCLTGESVSSPWKEAWVLIIPKPYEWESVLTNTCPIALIKTAHKILSKILSDRISTACSTFNVLHGDNFLVLKGTTTQSLIFVIGSVIENALEKDWKLWLVLQDMQKAYDSVSWEHLEKSLIRIKMCSKFIQFFGNIHRDRTNQVMTDFGLTDDYYAGLFSFFAAGAFVNDTIWVGSSQTTTQHILNVASKFFWVNNISINNDKTVAIPINSRFSSSSLSISGSLISIAKKGESHWYLSIFLSTEGLLKPISYRTQFSFILVSICNKWNALICKSLKLKSGLLLNFPNNMLHHPSFYGLKSFSQVQSECKIVSLVSFVNSDGILGHLLVLVPVHLLSSSVHVYVNASSNFLVDMVCILLDCNLFLSSSLANSFWSCSSILMSSVLDELMFFRSLSSLWRFGVAFVDQLCNYHGTKRLDLRGSIPEWFKHAMAFLNSVNSPSAGSLALDGAVSLNILDFGDFVSICDCLPHVGLSNISVYTDGSLKDLGTTSCKADTAAFFEDIGLGLGIGVLGLMSSTLAKLQAIALALKCILLSSSVQLFSDSQSALDACKSELGLVCPDFHNQCWVERHHIANVVRCKNLSVSWHKIKDHSGISENEHANLIAGAASLSVADNSVVSGNSRHFVHDIYHSICHTCWEVGSGSKFLANNLLSEVDWPYSLLVWHPDLHMATSFTNKLSAGICTYFMKALYYRLPVVVQKRLYNRCYPSVLCLYCGEIETLDHVFFCKVDNSTQSHILESHANSWKTLFGLSHSSFCVLQLLLSCVSDFLVSMALYKGFVFNDWFHEAVSIFHNPKIAGLEVVKFVRSLAYMEKANLILLDDSALVTVSGLASGFFTGVVKLLGITEALGICFGFCKSCLFFLDINGSVSVHIAV
ncbi:hypothetical protein G9A89_015423 [Geosiphon pyriformis]|nr:hypothetical protein G9A89_015423 [Geosiphon pyriformis]